MSIETPNVALCLTAAHLEGCGECADVIGKIVKEEILALTERDPVPAPEAAVEKAKHFDANGVELSGMFTSHADIPNGSDHPIEYGDRCGICIARTRRGSENRGAAAVISALDRM